MQNEMHTGVYGKLPAHGDFIYRELPNQFINVWDQWLQGYIGSSKEQLGEAWLDIYLTSPIWRFVVSEGVIDGNAWAGVVLPSVDRVGRYFPFSVITRLNGKTNPAEFITTRRNWFQALEDAALRALDGKLHIDELVEELNDSMPMKKDTYRRVANIETPNKMLMELNNPDISPSSVLPFMLDACLLQSLQTYSIWSTAGSSLIKPSVFVAKGLPPLNGIAAMLDGQWATWQWQQPFTLNENLLENK